MYSQSMELEFRPPPLLAHCLLFQFFSLDSKKLVLSKSIIQQQCETYFHPLVVKIQMNLNEQMGQGGNVKEQALNLSLMWPRLVSLNPVVRRQPVVKTNVLPSALALMDGVYTKSRTHIVPNKPAQKSISDLVLLKGYVCWYSIISYCQQIPWRDQNNECTNKYKALIYLIHAISFGQVRENKILTW